MCGSLGHFWCGGERDKALRPVPQIFDSVRRKFVRASVGWSTKSQSCRCLFKL